MNDIEIEIDPELAIPLDTDVPVMDLCDRAQAMFNTACLLEEEGLEIDPPTASDTMTAEALAESYAANPEKTSKTVTNNRAATMTPASMVMTAEILKEFSHVVVQNSQQIRHFVTNKLLLEAENPDARIRMKALELLGKISDVGLFAEKSEVTITHQSSDEIKDKLRQKLEKLINPEPEEAFTATMIEDAQYEEIPTASLADIDVDEALDG